MVAHLSNTQHCTGAPMAASNRLEITADRSSGSSSFMPFHRMMVIRVSRFDTRVLCALTPQAHG